jgi:hypothetical protein
VGIPPHGGNHDVYLLDGIRVPIPRHSELDDRFVTNVLWPERAAKLGEDWWK